MPLEVPLLEVRAVSKTFPIEGGVFRQRIGSVQALKNVSFKIWKGETLAVAGGSGCGKSTLARILVGLLAPDSGEMIWENKKMTLPRARSEAHRIQMIFQDPFASLNPKLSIETQLAEVVALNKTSKTPVRRRCVELLESVGLPGDALSHYPFQFSGGQRQRIAIARALALQPALLIADEPLSALDVTIQAQMLTLFKDLKKTLGLTILFITHDLAIVGEFADRLLVLEAGQIAEEGPAAEVLSKPHHPYTQALLDAVPRIHGLV